MKYVRATCLVLVCVLSTSAYSQQGDCFAFIRNGAIVLNCAGKILEGKDLGIQGFAVSEDGQLGLLRSSPGPIVKGGSELVNKSILVDLRNSTQRPFAFYPDDFCATCGTLLAEATLRNGVVKASTGESAMESPYLRYRCSGDRSVLVGETKKSDDLVLVQESKHTALEKTGDSSAFDVSPSGSYVAYSKDGRICLVSDGSSVGCARATTVGGVSVSNGGSILFTQGTNQNCVYSDSWHFRPHPLSDTLVHQDECLAIMLWHPGMELPSELATLGRQPQWIPGKWVDPLKRWLAVAASGPGNPSH